MVFSLPNLPYKYEDLEPHIDAETMNTHHTKHHVTYINKLNTTVKDNDIKEDCLATLLTEIDKNTTYSGEVKKMLINNGGGHLNHSLFWCYMTPKSDITDIGEGLMKEMDKDFESFDNFKKTFDSNAVALFGSGWVWLCFDKSSKKLTIISSGNQDNPLMYDANHIPLLGLDVWEHAYYLRYKNKRPEYVSNWWNVVNWKFVNCAYESFVVKGKKFEMTPDGTLKL
ncbi:Superoxide dismutase [Mn] 1 [Nosema bombycis CQ1]|uniref:Superoxide dismutase n=2 Tax=Nosema bombycis TaxID=27978 RepID=R0MHL3_NOSB1|nr:manganese superoxide dismutase 1 [Nosema bombycis]EOB12288.1 Superoxide dismutase [Mn] 1 [Nosema bombycis CQ1]|eukprot:EOB12288.1 Superoxide dismutase [Mn] 1 [Nosema bombycis CQ1]